MPLIARIIARASAGSSATRRAGSEKLVSLFEPHADIIRKGGRQVQYGHKLNLATGKSGLILDVVVEAGNPADAERFLPCSIATSPLGPGAAADRRRWRLRQPRQPDRGQGRGVADVAFHKKCGIAIADMVKSPWVYRRLRNFRAGIEAGISCFKRAYGAARCTWRGLDHFKAYIWSAAVATTWCCSPPQTGLASPAAAGDSAAGQSTRPTLLALNSLAPCRYCHAQLHRRPPEPHHRPPCYATEKHAFMDGH